MEHWLLNNWIEIVGAITGVLYIYLSVKQHMALWLIGILSSAFYIVVFFNSKLYADAGLQTYYLLISGYGWWHWIHGKPEHQVHLNPTFASIKLLIILLLITIVLTGCIALILINFTNSDVPWWDAFTSAASIIATWMLTQKYIQHWIAWIFIDIIYVGLYFYKDLYFTIILYVVFTIMALIGYFEWRKKIILST